jgi:Fe-S-cluster containining protein
MPNHRASQQTECRRCGTCCRKGGPCLHTVDLPLIEQGAIRLADLFTIRPGEWVHDNVRGGLIPATTDIIKIKNTRRQACSQYDPKHQGCRIYINRPMECHLLKCWDTREMEAFYATHRLSRKDLLYEVAGLWELIEYHQSVCDHANLRKWVDELLAPTPCASSKAKEKILQAVSFDANMRQLAMEKVGADAEQFDFFFGRPLIQTLKVYRLTVDHDANGPLLKSLAKP